MLNWTVWNRRVYMYKNRFCTPYIMASPSSINTCQPERQTDFTNQRDTITCDTICGVDRYSLPHWTLSFLSTNYCLTRFTCIFFFYVNIYVFLSAFFVVPVSFFWQHHNTLSNLQQLMCHKTKSKHYVEETPSLRLRNHLHCMFIFKCVVYLFLTIYKKIIHCPNEYDSFFHGSSWLKNRIWTLTINQSRVNKEVITMTVYSSLLSPHIAESDAS